MFGQKRILNWSALGWLCVSPALAVTADNGAAAQVSADEVVRRMLEMDGWRRNALRRYTSSRLYVAENKRFNKRAEVTVRETYSYPGKKEFSVVSENGSWYVRHRVIDKLIEAEVDAGQKENRDQTRITPENYRFRLIGTEQADGVSCFVVEVIPKQAKKYLMRGLIWVDRQDVAITRMEGRPAKNPSFWTRKVRITRRYRKYGPFWLPVSTESESDIFIAGRSSLRIGYTDYKINLPQDGRKGDECGSLSGLNRPVRAPEEAQFCWTLARPYLRRLFGCKPGLVSATNRV